MDEQTNEETNEQSTEETNEQKNEQLDEENNKETTNEEITVQPNDWLKEESDKLETETNFEEIPSLFLEENKVVKFYVDFSKPFDQWEDKKNNSVKAIIPTSHEEVRKNLWLNKKNPLYAEIIKRGKEGKDYFEVIRTGSQADTKYSLVN